MEWNARKRLEERGREGSEERTDNQETENVRKETKNRKRGRERTKRRHIKSAVEKKEKGSGEGDR